MNIHFGRTPVRSPRALTFARRFRILVPSDAVGAIIGKQGSTVKQIKQTTHAKYGSLFPSSASRSLSRIDVNKGAASTSSERLMVIRGQPENCLQACREILLIMSTDARNKNKSVELVLKVLAHNNFIGRIIGKGGNIINAIKKDTETNITVSSVNEHHSNDIDRIISIKGELDQQLRALEMIYSKLCLAFEHDQARGWDYASTAAAAAAASPYYQEHLVHYINQQSVAGPPLMSTQYAQAQSNGINSPSTKYLEQPSQANVIYPPAYYVGCSREEVTSNGDCAFPFLATDLLSGESVLHVLPTRSSSSSTGPDACLSSLSVRQRSTGFPATTLSVSVRTHGARGQRNCTFICSEYGHWSDHWCERSVHQKYHQEFQCLGQSESSLQAITRSSLSF